jgi:hypothetical protein
VPNPVCNPLRQLPILRWIYRSKPSLGEGGVKIVLNQRGGIEGEFIEGWEMFREDFWEEEEKRIQEDAEAAKRERKTHVIKLNHGQPGTRRSKRNSNANVCGKKKRSVSGSISSVKTSSMNGGSGKKVVKKKKRTAEQAIVGL